MKATLILSLLIYFLLIFNFTLIAQINNLVTLNVNTDEKSGWQDLIFTITEKNLDSTGMWNIVCKAKYKDHIVGLRIRILEGIEAGLPKEGIDNTKFVPKGAEFESIGEESDRLIEVVSKLFQQKTQTAFTKESLAFTIFPLNDKKANLREGRFHFKLFFDDNNERGLYSEFYLNPNFPNETIEFNEKDEAYRVNIVQSMANK